MTEDGVGVSAYVPPPSPEEIGVSCGSMQTREGNNLQKKENLENYPQDRRSGGEKGSNLITLRRVD